MEASVWRISVSISSLKEEEGPGSQSRHGVSLKHMVAFLRAAKAGVPGVGLCPLGKIVLLAVVGVATKSPFKDASELMMT